MARPSTQGYFVTKKNNKDKQDKRASAKPAAGRRKRADTGRDPNAEREAQRYERPIPSREAILALLEERGEMLTEARIAEALAL